MKSENVIVHTVWVGGELSLLEQLTIKLLQYHKHEVHLWTYDGVKNVPEGTIVQNASEIMPRESIFTYQGSPLSCIPNGGIGSLSHWSDQFQLKLLAMKGGIYSQLDVAYLVPLDIQSDYFFINQRGRDLVSFMMKCPKGCSFAIEGYADLKNNINSQTIKYMDWDCSMRAMMRVLQKHFDDSKYKNYFMDQKNYMDFGCTHIGPFFSDWEINNDIYCIHWSNATVHEHKNNPIQGSTYHKLLKLVNLINV